MALTIKTDWKMQDIVTPEHMNRIEGNTKTLETDLTSGLSGKVDKVAGKGLSTLDFTTALRDKINTSETKITALESNKLNVTDFTKTNILSKLGTEEVNLNVSKLQGKSASDFLTVDGKAVDSAKLNGATESTASTGNTIVKRTEAGNIVAFKFQEGTQLLENKYASKTTTDEHIDNKTNPHNVTKAQVGLNLVENLSVATSAEIIQGTIKKYVTSDILKGALSSMAVGTAENALTLEGASAGETATPSTIVKRTAEGDIYANDFNLNGKRLAEIFATITDLNSHKDNVSNPHGVDKAQVGLSNLENWEYGSTSDIVEGTSNRYATSYSVLKAIEHLVTDKYVLLESEDLSGKPIYTINKTGWSYSGSKAFSSSVPNGETGNWATVLTLRRGAKDSNPNYQFYFGAASNGFYVRRRQLATDDWSGWRFIGSASFGTSTPTSLKQGEIYVQY